MKMWPFSKKAPPEPPTPCSDGTMNHQWHEPFKQRTKWKNGMDSFPNFGSIGLEIKPFMSWLVYEECPSCGGSRAWVPFVEETKHVNADFARIVYEEQVGRPVQAPSTLSKAIKGGSENSGQAIGSFFGTKGN